MGCPTSCGKGVDFADRAEPLFIMMADSISDEASTVEMNELAASFWATEDRIEAKLELHRLSGWEHVNAP